jgi:hypothetical protein
MAATLTIRKGTGDAMTTLCPYGFRIVGPCTEARRTVNWSAAFGAYAACDDRAEVTREAYLSAFTFGADFREQLETTGTVKGYAGECFAPWLWLDIDRTELSAALHDCRRLVTTIGERLGIAEGELLAFYSGSKGFHIGIPTALWTPKPSATFNRIARRFAERIAEAAGASIDTRVYDRVRAFRAPNSRHGKTGRHKRRLPVDEIIDLSADAIVRLAATPEPFEIPSPFAQSEAAAALWLEASELVQREADAKAARQTTGDSSATLNRLTLEFIRSGAAVGERHPRIFSAAANLAEFGCPPALAHALLTEAGLDCGLSPSEVRRQIDCGLNHTGGAA